MVEISENQQRLIVLKLRAIIVQEILCAIEVTALNENESAILSHALQAIENLIMEATLLGRLEKQNRLEGTA